MEILLMVQEINSTTFHMQNLPLPMVKIYCQPGVIVRVLNRQQSPFSAPPINATRPEIA